MNGTMRAVFAYRYRQEIDIESSRFLNDVENSTRISSKSSIFVVVKLRSSAHGRAEPALHAEAQKSTA
jgi:hypothetical protein